MKSRQAIRRLKTRGTKHTNMLERYPAANAQPQQPMSVKEAEAILIDVSLRELYNNGDKRELNFVDEILEPNQIAIPKGEPLESFWDILTNTGLMKAVIGFGKHGSLALTSEGYQLMNQYGSYGNFLHQRQAQLIRDKEDPETNVDNVTPPPAPPLEPMDGVH